MSPDLPTAGVGMGAVPGGSRTVTAEEIGFELVNRCDVEFVPVGERAPVRGRLIELVQPLPGGGLRELGLEEYTTLYVTPDGDKTVIAFPIPARRPVAVTVDPPSDPSTPPDGP